MSAFRGRRSTVARRLATADQRLRGWWNGQRVARYLMGSAVVAEAALPEIWCRDLVGQRISVVEVQLGPCKTRQGTYDGHVFYLDNRAGEAVEKLTIGRGHPRLPHRQVPVVEGSFRADPDVVDKVLAAASSGEFPGSPRLYPAKVLP